jgi:DNA modification methylase
MSVIDRIVFRPLGDDPPEARLLYGQDVRASLRLLEPESVQVVCTSPPYWGLRDYGGEVSVWGGDPDCEHEWGQEEGYLGHRGNRGQVPQTKWKSNETYPQQADAKASPQSWCGLCGAWLGQFGLEPTPALYVEHMVEVFEEIRRVLRPDGTAWLNLGDSYNGSGGFAPGAPSNEAGSKQTTVGGDSKVAYTSKKRRGVSTLKPKDLVGIPWRVAFGLQDDGWYLRSDIIWAKGNPMPESVRDRPTRAHEFIFLLTKESSYFYDQHAIREGFADARMGRDGGKQESVRNVGGRKDGYTKPNNIDPSANGGRNKRTVWNVNPKSYPGAHFAVWPEELVEPMIKAGSSEYGCCSECRAPFKRMVDVVVPEGISRTRNVGGRTDGYTTPTHGGGIPPSKRTTVGWGQTCKCKDPDVTRCLVLDPFSGSATTGAVAMRLGRNYVGTDLQPDYLDLAEARLAGRRAPSKDTDTEDPIGDLFG